LFIDKSSGSAGVPKCLPSRPYRTPARSVTSDPRAEMGALQERITSTKKGLDHFVQACNVPGRRSEPPGPATTFAHLDATIVLERSIAEMGIYPAVDPLASTSGPSRRKSSAKSTTRRAWSAEGAAATQRPAGYHCNSRLDELARRTRSTYPCPQDSRFLSQPSAWRKYSAGGRATSPVPKRCGASRRSSQGSTTRGGRRLLHEGRDRKVKPIEDRTEHGRHAEIGDRTRRPGTPKTWRWSPCQAWRPDGDFATTCSLISQMVPGEMIVRKDGRDLFIARAKDSSEVPPARRHLDGPRHSWPTALTRRKPKKRGNAPKPVSAKNSRTNKSLRQRRAHSLPRPVARQANGDACNMFAAAIPANNFAISACKVLEDYREPKILDTLLTAITSAVSRISEYEQDGYSSLSLNEEAFLRAEELECHVEEEDSAEKFGAFHGWLHWDLEILPKWRIDNDEIWSLVGNWLRRHGASQAGSDEIINLGWDKQYLLLDDVAVVRASADGSFTLDREAFPAPPTSWLQCRGPPCGPGARRTTARRDHRSHGGRRGSAAVSASVGIDDDFVTEVKG